MAGKKARPRKTTKKVDLERLKHSDVLCPICRTILIEPVTLSCDHVFCKLCFEGTMENANLVCPLCRIRVGSWFRRAKKDGKLVDEKLWEAIRTQYPKEVQNRYQGIDNAMEADVHVIVVATPGEIRKEYEQQRQKDLEEQKKIREKEEKASAVLLKKIKEEEEQQKKLEEQKLRLDAALARKLAEELERPTTSKVASKKPTETKGPKSNKKYGPMDKFIKSDEVQSNRRSLTKSEEKKSIFKGARRISTTPNPSSDFATKEYTCHVLNAESNSKNPVNYLDILNRPGYNKSSYSGEMPTVKRKVKAPRKIVEVEQRKSICKSGYKSSSSGSDDTIGQECKFYFKPIDTQRRYHLPGTVPLRVTSLKGKPTMNVDIQPPSGKIINLQLGTVLSAFASFSLELQQNPQSYQSLTREVIEKEPLDHHVGPSNRLKRKLFDQDSPVKRKGRRQIYKKKNFQNIEGREVVSSPFYGFEVDSSRLVNNSPFYGFDTLEIQKSNRGKDAIRKLIYKSVVNTKGLFKTFKTYSRHQNRYLNETQRSINNDVNSYQEPLKLQILKKPKNGINMSEAIKNKLAELTSSVNGPREDFQARMGIDVNRNVPKIKTQGNNDLNYSDANITLEPRTRPKIVKQKEIEPVKSLSKNTRHNMNRTHLKLRGDSRKLKSSSNEQKSLEYNVPKTNVVHVVADYPQNSYPKVIDAQTRTDSAGSELIDSKARTDGSDMSSLKIDVNNADGSLKELSTSPSSSNSRINGSWRTKQKDSSARKLKNTEATSIAGQNSRRVARISPKIGDTTTAGASTEFCTNSKGTRTEEDTSFHPNKTYQSKRRNAAFIDTNSKITDTFYKIKSSPTKPKNTIRKLKLSPAKTKLNNNLELEIDVHQKEIQEQSDFEMAKRLQEEFNSIQMPSRTRRGTKRQITLDEMLLV